MDQLIQLSLSMRHMLHTIELNHLNEITFDEYSTMKSTHIKHSYYTRNLCMTLPYSSTSGAIQPDGPVLAEKVPIP